MLAKVEDRVAVVGEDGVDERFADVVYVTVNRREHNFSFRVAFGLFEKLFEVLHGFLHDFR